MGIKGFKGFNPDMTCLGKQYEENTIFSEAEAVVCKKGMHFCVNPFDVLDYYPILNKECKFNVFAEVESLSEADTTDSCKFSTSEIKIGKKLNWKEFVESYLDIIQNDCPNKTELTSNDYAQIGSSGNGAKIGSSGDGAKIGSSGYGAKIGSSGDYAKIGSSGNYAKIGSSGDYAQIGSSGNGAQIGSSGYGAKIGSSSDYAKIGSSGDYAKIGSSGYNAKIGSSGYGAQIGSSGNGAKIGSSGDDAKIGSSGYGAQIGSSGDYAKIGSSGYNAQISSEGLHSVICCAGYGAKAQAKIGSWITLAEWKDNIPVCVKTEQVDGIKIKEDTWYTLKNGEFQEVENV